MRRQLLQLFRPALRPRTVSWLPNNRPQAAPPRPPRIDRAEIIRRTERQVRNLLEEEGEVEEEAVVEIAEARRGIWGGLNGGKLFTAENFCALRPCSIAARKSQ